ncbi:MAG: poly-gamma-glutamate synthase PgsB [Comamonadaceae bacterium]
MSYLPLFFFLIVGYLVLERIRHEKRLKRIKIRIHVNGTRGKSSVTRLIAAALRRSGIRTLAKTTGMAPELILPNGTRETIRRWAPANILEQLKVIRRADQLQVDAVVIECMALDPVLQFVSETKLIRSTIGVITNVRPDHFEVMGGSLDDIARALSQTIPEHAVLITADAAYFPLFSSLARPLQTDAILADAATICVQHEWQSHLIFRENLAVAKQVCSQLALDPALVDLILAEECSSSEGSVIFTRSMESGKICFIDAFSANDIESTRIIQDWAFARTHCPRPWVALYNNREDRPLRMRSFAGFLAHASRYDCVAVVGDSLGPATRYLSQSLPDSSVLPIRCSAPELVIAELFKKLSCREFTIVGMGNEKGAGLLLSRFFKGSVTA